MKKIVLLSFAVIGAFTATSCSDDDNNNIDVTKPNIEIISPASHAEIEPGNSFFFKANISDDSGLASYKIEVHYADDGHEHKKAFAEEFVFDVTEEYEINPEDFKTKGRSTPFAGVKVFGKHIATAVKL